MIIIIGKNAVVIAANAIASAGPSGIGTKEGTVPVLLGRDQCLKLSGLPELIIWVFGRRFLLWGQPNTLSRKAPAANPQQHIASLLIAGHGQAAATVFFKGSGGNQRPPPPPPPPPSGWEPLETLERSDQRL